MDFYFNSVLNAFSAMDSKEIGELLNPEYTYQEVPLDVFVNKLEKVFQEFKKHGDTHLEVQSGNCCGLTCNPELIRTAYRFVGNQSRSYLDFRFITEPTEDLRDHLIKDIFECGILRCHERKDWYGQQFSLRVYDDEKPEFYQTPDEIIHSEIAVRAESELEERYELSLEELENWLMQYRSTFEFIQDSESFDLFQSRRWDGFYYLYETIQWYPAFLKKWNKSALVTTWKDDVELPEDVLMEVIQDAEGILEEVGYEFFLTRIIGQDIFHPFSHYPGVVGKLAEDFNQSMVWFRSRQRELVKKYFALTQSETDDFLEKDEFGNAETSLKMLSFHMQIRNQAKERGEFVPLNLGVRGFDVPF